MQKLTKQAGRLYHGLEVLLGVGLLLFVAQHKDAIPHQRTSTFIYPFG